MANILDRNSKLNPKNQMYISVANYLGVEDWRQVRDMYENAPEITQKEFNRYYWYIRSEESREDTKKAIEELQKYEELTR